MKKTNDKYKILLLTNRDSDNVGDQTIEACDISLIKAVMHNLEISDSEFEINSRAASIVNQQYLKTRDLEFLRESEDVISSCSVVLFGGAPVFNYLYQNLYERTAITIELAEKYNKPVLFSAIGVDGYDENNKKCQRITDKINSKNVVQITTRDNIEALRKYVIDLSKISKVADPAVFSNYVFEKSIKEKSEKPRIGLFVFRGHGFKDNKINFSRGDAIKMWLELATELRARGYECEYITSGHSGDEVTMDYMIRNCGVKGKECVFAVNQPEDLISRISSYAGVISCRLHPSILSFSLDVPSLGIVWNNKVKAFYESIGYDDRIIYTDNIDVKKIVDKLEQIVKEPIKKDIEYLMTVYNSLFYGLKSALKIETENKPYTFEELTKVLPRYPGTSEKELNEKINRKFRRAYKIINSKEEKIGELKKKCAAKKKPPKSLPRRIYGKMRRIIKTKNKEGKNG